MTPNFYDLKSNIFYVKVLSYDCKEDIIEKTSNVKKRIKITLLTSNLEKFIENFINIDVSSRLEQYGKDVKKIKTKNELEKVGYKFKNSKKKLNYYTKDLGHMTLKYDRDNLEKFKYVVGKIDDVRGKCVITGHKKGHIYKVNIICKGVEEYIEIFENLFSILKEYEEKNGVYYQKSDS